MLQGKYPLLIALVLAVLAGLIAYSAMVAKMRQLNDGWETQEVLCAARDISEGSELDEDSIAICEIPEKFVTDSFIKIAGEDQKERLPLGQKVLVPLKQRDPILYSHFESQREFTLSEGIPPKARAIALELTEKGSVNQWIRPNDHVDVIGTFRDEESRGMMTTTVLEDIIVLATGRITGLSTYVADEDKRYNHVVLLVGAEEAEILALAQETGQLSLTLRNPTDREVNERAPGDAAQVTTIKTLLTKEKVNALREIRQKSFQGIDVIRGSTRSVETGRGSMEH